MKHASNVIKSANKEQQLVLINWGSLS